MFLYSLHIQTFCYRYTTPKKKDRKFGLGKNSDHRRHRLAKGAQ